MSGRLCPVWFHTCYLRGRRQGAADRVAVYAEAARERGLGGQLLGGPVAAGDVPVNLAQLSDTAKAILSAAMILGRLETLAIIALLNPEFWR